MPRQPIAHLSARQLRALVRGRPPATPAILRLFLRDVLHLEIPTNPLTPGSAAPFDYLVHTFFEGQFSTPSNSTPAPSDCVVWAARGAGKTFLGAVATLLDLLFKPGIEIRILGGSLEQSQRMHEHLRRLFEPPHFAALLRAPITSRRIILLSGARAQILAQSQTSIRGARVQKLRCDEVELFDPEVWEAAQLTTRSMNLPGPWGPVVRGSVEALSTMHRPYGLMWNLVSSNESAPESDAAPSPAPTPPPRARAIYRWGLIDVLARCGPTHACSTCALTPDCAGRAKDRDARASSIPGHVRIDDAVNMKARVSLAVWESEMLCLRPRRTDCVFPEFDPRTHVGDWNLDSDSAPADPRADHVPAFALSPAAPPSRRWIAGMDFGFRSPTVLLLAWYREDDPHRVLHIEAEHIRSEWTVDRHARILLGETDADEWPRPAPRIRWVGVDPAGHQRSSQTGISSVAALRQVGLAVRSRRLSLHEGLELLRVRLRPAGGVPGEASPRIFIHRRCTQLIESLQRYHFPEDRPEALEPVKDGSDHAIDALRYLITCLDKPHQSTHHSY